MFLPPKKRKITVFSLPWSSPPFLKSYPSKLLPKFHLLPPHIHPQNPEDALLPPPLSKGVWGGQGPEFKQRSTGNGCSPGTEVLTSASPFPFVFFVLTFTSCRPPVLLHPASTAVEGVAVEGFRPTVWWRIRQKKNTKTQTNFFPYIHHFS